MAEKSKVYFADFRAPSWRENLPQKLARLMMTAGFGDIDMDGKYVAIKMHFGEPGNLAYLRPNWARAVVDLVKSHGGKPFLTDCNTLYVGGRKNALDHIESAYINGFTPYSTGCHILIADGLKGNDEVEVPVEGGEYVMFTYEGLGTGLQEFILTVYGTCMPMLNLTRRKGLDIERFYPEDESRDQATPIQLRCEYLIPIRR